MDSEPHIVSTSPSDYATFAAAQLHEARLVADRLFLSDELAAAATVFEQLLARSYDASWCLFQLGRIAARQDRPLDAIERFDQALAGKDPSVWVHFEKAMALQALGSDAKTILAELVCFARQPPGELADGHCAVLLKGAQDAFDAALHEEAYLLYDLLVRRGYGGYYCELRRADLHLLKGDAEEALLILDRLIDDPEYDVWGEVTRARALLSLKRFKAAAVLLKAVVDRAPENADFVRLLFDALEGSGDAAELAEAEKFLHRLPKDQRFEFSLRTELRLQNYERMAQLCSEYPVVINSLAARLVSHAINGLIDKRDFATIDRLIEAVGPLESRPLCITSSALSALFARHDWEGAAQLLAMTDAIPGSTGDPELRLRKLQFLCFTLQLEQAEAFLGEWSIPAEVPEIASATVGTLYAALGQWNRVLDLFRDRIARGFSIAGDHFVEAVSRAARQTGEYAEVLRLVSDALETRSSPTLVDFRDRLLAEVSLLHSLDLLDPGVDWPANPTIATPLYAHRAALLSAALDDAGGGDMGSNIYLCTDINYLVGTCVAVFSLLRNNPGIGSSHSLTVVCSDEAMPLGTSIFAKIATAYSASIRIRPFATLLDQGYRFQTRWGLFTPGHALSDAAYYRIFMALRLIEEGVRGVALYLDSDTCIGSGLRGLVRLPHGPSFLCPRSIALQSNWASIPRNISILEYYCSIYHILTCPSC
jgi:tetratricopeptide (TPR) repeat protein